MIRLRTLLLSIGLFLSLPNLSAKTSIPENESQGWLVGVKLHFEDEGGSDYLGINEINKITMLVLHKSINISSESCGGNEKIMLIRENGKVKAVHYEEKSKPGIGEEMHATLLYTKPRGFGNSETLRQICPNLFEKCSNPPTLESVAKAYGSIIKQDSKFKIEKVKLVQNPNRPSFIIAELSYNNHKNILLNGRPISAALHLTLVNINDDTILSNKNINDLIVRELNRALKGRMIKVAEKNGITDLELGFSGLPWRLRAGMRD